jgi:hypothetical protein
MRHEAGARLGPAQARKRRVDIGRPRRRAASDEGREHQEFESHPKH